MKKEKVVNKFALIMLILCNICWIGAMFLSLFFNPLEGVKNTL